MTRSILFSCILYVFTIYGCSDVERSTSAEYDSDSPYAPLPQTSREIDEMRGTASEKAAAKDAVRRFNEAAAKRGERPTGL